MNFKQGFIEQLMVYECFDNSCFKNSIKFEKWKKNEKKYIND